MPAERSFVQRRVLARLFKFCSLRGSLALLCSKSNRAEALLSVPYEYVCDAYKRRQHRSTQACESMGFTVRVSCRHRNNK